MKLEKKLKASLIILTIIQFFIGIVCSIVLAFSIPILLYLTIGSLFINAKLVPSQVSEKTVFIHTLWEDLNHE